MHALLTWRPPAKLLLVALVWAVAVVGFVLLTMQMPQGTAPDNAAGHGVVSAE
jgi:hypothetical protein